MVFIICEVFNRLLVMHRVETKYFNEKCKVLDWYLYNWHSYELVAHFTSVLIQRVSKQMQPLVILCLCLLVCWVLLWFQWIPLVFPQSQPVPVSPQSGSNVFRKTRDKDLVFPFRQQPITDLDFFAKHALNESKLMYNRVISSIDSTSFHFFFKPGLFCSNNDYIHMTNSISPEVGLLTSSL